ncbi:hypothetical protein HK100_009619, partial [Physocladia obscura]
MTSIQSSSFFKRRKSPLKATDPLKLKVATSKSLHSRLPSIASSIASSFSISTVKTQPQIHHESQKIAGNSNYNNNNNSLKTLSSLPSLTLKSAPRVDVKKLNSLHAAVHASDVARVKSLVSGGYDLNKLDRVHGFTAMHLAVSENKMEIAKLLLDATTTNPAVAFNFDCVDHDGRTLLILSVIHGHSEFTSELLEKVVKIDIRDSLGCTALDYAIHFADITAVRLLLERNPTLSLLDE